MFLRLLQKVPKLGELGIYRRLLPILPDALGCIAAAFGGIPAVADKPLIVRLAAGLWCGYLAQRFHKILGQTVLGDDRLSISKPTHPAVVTLPAGEPPTETSGGEGG